jgi:Vacuolar protein sorting-associated protein 35
MEDGKRVLECLQRALRVAGSSFEEIISLQLYCDALDRYIYYFDRKVEEVSISYLFFVFGFSEQDWCTRSRQNMSIPSLN